MRRETARERKRAGKNGKEGREIKMYVDIYTRGNTGVSVFNSLGELSLFLSLSIAKDVVVCSGHIVFSSRMEYGLTF